MARKCLPEALRRNFTKCLLSVSAAMLFGCVRHSYSFSTYQVETIKVPLPDLLMTLAVKCRVPNESKWESFREVVRAVMLRRQPGPDFDKCLAYCMMDNMNMFAQYGTLMDPTNTQLEFGPYFDNYEQDKILRCVMKVNRLRLGRGMYARCNRATAFLSCFNKGVFRLTWENLLLDEAARCRKKLQLNDTWELVVVDHIIHRKTPDDSFPECLLQCMFRELGMFHNSSTNLLSKQNTVDNIGYYFEEADKHKMSDCVEEANSLKVQSMFHHCSRAKYFLTCFNRDTSLIELQRVVVNAADDCRKTVGSTMREVVATVHAILYREKPSPGVSPCLLYCVYRMMGMIPEYEAIFNDDIAQASVGAFYINSDRTKMTTCIAKGMMTLSSLNMANNINKSRYEKPHCEMSRVFLECFNTPPVHTTYGHSSLRLDIRNMAGSFGTTMKVAGVSEEATDNYS